MLHYDPKWLDYGFVDFTLLEKQLVEYRTREDDNLEHYRFEAFKALLERTDVLDEVTFQRYIEMANLDEDQTMARAALGMLARHPKLTDAQILHIRTDPSFAMSALQDIIEQTIIFRALDAPNLSDELFDRCVSRGNAEVQRKLLHRTELSRDQLACLMQRGVNKAIRNIAANRLRQTAKLFPSTGRENA